MYNTAGTSRQLQYTTTTSSIEMSCHVRGVHRLHDLELERFISRLASTVTILLFETTHLDEAQHRTSLHRNPFTTVLFCETDQTG